MGTGVGSLHCRCGGKGIPRGQLELGHEGRVGGPVLVGVAREPLCGVRNEPSRGPKCTILIRILEFRHQSYLDQPAKGQGRGDPHPNPPNPPPRGMTEMVAIEWPSIFLSPQPPPPHNSPVEAARGGARVGLLSSGARVRRGRLGLPPEVR